MLKLYLILYLYLIVNINKNNFMHKKINKTRYLGEKVYQVGFSEVKAARRLKTLQIKGFPRTRDTSKWQTFKYKTQGTVTQIFSTKRTVDLKVSMQLKYFPMLSKPDLGA